MTTELSNLNISLVGINIINLHIDFYLTSSEDFGHALKAVDSRIVLDSLAINIDDDESHDSQNDSYTEDTTITHFNEKLVRVICLNQAIDKYQRELEIIKAERDQSVEIM